ncbi:MAG TPA: GTPase [Candidatus Norongarragalinales archaeon]|jgi:hypothetical protein|nr:GTPase [Candidatus Norongarragalinales archaeon]
MASLNAGPEYYAAEERFRNAKAFEEKLEALQEMERYCPKHKSAESILRVIRSKRAQLIREHAKEEIRKKLQKGGKGEFVKKQGGAQIALVGFPNSGKTALFNALCGLKMPSTSSPFETTKLEPGMWLHNNVQVQVLDTPSINEQVKSRIFAYSQTADLVIIVLDSSQKLEEQKKFFEYNNPIFLKQRPAIFIDVKQECPSWKKECLQPLKERLYKQLGLVRVYTKSPRGEADFSRPIVLHNDNRTVAEAAKEIHKDLYRNLEYGRVWGPSARFPGMRVSADHDLQDGDVLELHMREPKQS